MTFTHQPYSGDKNGDLDLLVCKNGNYITSIGLTASGGDSLTQDYANSGGETFATDAELLPFKANKAF